jgi:nucleotide-binding universal stress UspA family protein
MRSPAALRPQMPARPPDVAEGANVRRILVALDPSPHGHAALVEAIALAERMGAEVVGLFVEDEDLLRIARLPFAREFGVCDPHGRALDIVGMERRLRAQGVAMRREMEREAARTQLSWSFRVARGRVAAEVVAAGEQADVIFVGRTREQARSARLGSTARAVLTRSRRTVFCVRHRAAGGRAVVAAYDGSDASGRALHTAADLAGAGPDGVVVLVPAGAEADALTRRALEILGEIGKFARVTRIDAPTFGALAETAARLDARAVVFGEGACGISPELAESLADALDRPVVIVR